jgi:hypothetical protein
MNKIHRFYEICLTMTFKCIPEGLDSFVMVHDANNRWIFNQMFAGMHTHEFAQPLLPTRGGFCRFSSATAHSPPTITMECQTENMSRIFAQAKLRGKGLEFSCSSMTGGLITDVDFSWR